MKIDISGTTIAKIPGNTLRNNENRENYARCRVSERRKFTVADKYLINDII